MKRKCRYFVSDFETTVYKGQIHTEVWAAASVELFTEDVQVFHSIDDLFQYYIGLNDHVIVYFHNLKFDGTFWMNYLLVDQGLEQASIQLDENPYNVAWVPDHQMKNDTFKYAISDMGQWYKILIKIGGKYIEIRDSLKLLPFSVERIGNSFKTKHRKLDMKYEGVRYAGCEITPEEMEYIKNDVLVVKEAVEIMFQEGHTNLTIGSCCLAEYKKLIGKDTYSRLFPKLTDIELQDYGFKSVDEYIRKSYKGGWCYVVPEKSKKILYNGTTADVNSLYPSVMHSQSGNKYPIGYPTFWKGNYIPTEATLQHNYYFVRIKTRFYLKRGKLPFTQIKNNIHYKGTEALKTSDIYRNGTYYRYIRDPADNIVKPTTVTLTLTMTDYELFLEHYNVEDFEILDGCYFRASIGIFDTYIDKYKRIKQTSKGAVRELAKLFLNNLYGKMASSIKSSFKYAYIKPDKTIGYVIVPAYDKEPGFIPVGSAITSYARSFTIRAAQANYHGPDKPGFVYADTDSIHCDLTPDKIKNITVHPTDFCCWKLESYWSEAIFTRQKTYIEHVTHEDGVELNEPKWDIKCAGMPDSCKTLFEKSMTITDLELQEIAAKSEKTDADIFLLSGRKTLTDFDIGLEMPGKLMPKQIRGGTILVETTYRMRDVRL